MVIMGTLIVDPVPPITMTHGITESGVIGVMWKMTKDIVTHSGQMWGKKLSLPGMLRGWPRKLQWLRLCAQRSGGMLVRPVILDDIVPNPGRYLPEFGVIPDGLFC